MKNSFITENQGAEGSVSLTFDSGSTDPLTGLDLTYLNDKHRRQQEALERFRNDPSSVDPLTGLNLLQLREKHHSQEGAMQAKLRDDLVVDAESDMTLGELRSRHENARHEREELKKNGVDPLTGISVAELNARHKRQSKEFSQK